MRKLIVTVLMILTALWAQSEDTIRVACIGNSITESSWLETQYPVELEKLLNEMGTYKVENYGVSGRTLLKHGDFPIWEETFFKQAIQFNPNIVTILLGTNDSKPQNWDDYSGEFVADYIAMIDTFAALDNNTQFVVCLPPPAFQVVWGINDTIIHDEIIPMILEVADSTGANICDFYNPMENDSLLFPDFIHPNEDGCVKMGQILFDVIKDLQAIVDTIPPYFTNLPANHLIFYDSAKVNIEVETSQYAEVKYSTQDVAFDEMEHTFDITGKKEHKTQFIGEHGKDYTLYFRAMDKAGNMMDTSAVFNFSIDTTKASSKWYMPEYDSDEWLMGSGSFGFGSARSHTVELASSHTVYFRKIFEVEDVSAILGFGLMVQAIGGIKVYLNGHEILMENLDEFSDIDFDSKAESEAYYQKVFTINDETGFGFVENGENLLAIELHAGKADYSELFFNAQMFDSKSQILFPLNSEWQYYSNQQEPDDQVVDKNGVGIDESEILPTRFKLEQNYPNPFNPTTMINYQLSINSDVHLDVLNIQGERVSTLKNEKQSAGNYQIAFDGSDFASGIYFYQLKTENYCQTRKMVLLK